MKASMKDVANHAGVSVATVSHVINQTRFVSESTRQKVLDSIKALNYVPDQMGKIFKTGKRNLIGIIIPDIANPVWAMLIEEVEGILSSQGFHIIISNTKETAFRELDNIRLLSSGIVDGLIIASTLTDYREIEASVPNGFPIVLVDRSLASAPWDAILPADYKAVYEGVERMIRAGHTRIGFISGLERLSTSAERLKAYRNAMEYYGLPVEPEFIQPGNSLANSALPLLQNLLNIGCSAVVASNNVMLDDVLFYLKDHNITPGKDLALFGQMLDGSANYNLRYMDMMVQQTKGIGVAAGEKMLFRLENPQAPAEKILLQSLLVKQTSTLSRAV